MGRRRAPGTRRLMDTSVEALRGARFGRARLWHPGRVLAH
jgi:hypothetical protein